MEHINTILEIRKIFQYSTETNISFSEICNPPLGVDIDRDNNLIIPAFYIMLFLNVIDISSSTKELECKIHLSSNKKENPVVLGNFKIPIKNVSQNGVFNFKKKINVSDVIVPHLGDYKVQLYIRKNSSSLYRLFFQQELTIN